MHAAAGCRHEQEKVNKNILKSTGAVFAGAATGAALSIGEFILFYQVMSLHP